MPRRNPLATVEPAAYLPPAGKTKRNREWDRQHNATVVSYRGIPIELQATIKEIAQRLHVSPGEVARAFLEHGLDAYMQGQLTLQPTPTAERLTLFPRNRKGQK